MPVSAPKLRKHGGRYSSNGFVRDFVRPRVLSKAEMAEQLAEAVRRTAAMKPKPKEAHRGPASI